MKKRHRERIRNRRKRERGERGGNTKRIFAFTKNTFTVLMGVNLVL